MGIIGRGVDRLERRKAQILDDLFARRGCSQADLRARINLAKRKVEALQYLINAEEKDTNRKTRTGQATCA